VVQVTAICDEIEPILNTGSAPNVESFVKESRARLVAAGAERIIDEIKTQIAAWEASR
jgi:hypothetical protein